MRAPQVQYQEHIKHAARRMARQEVRVRRVHAAFQNAKEETRKTTLKLSGFREAADMLKLVRDKAEEDPGWYIANETDNQRRLTRIFWMSPSQRALNLQYVWEKNRRQGEKEREKNLVRQGKRCGVCCPCTACEERRREKGHSCSYLLSLTHNACSTV